MMKNNMMGIAAQPGINQGGQQGLQSMAPQQNGIQTTPSMSQGNDPLDEARRRQQQRYAQEQYMGNRQAPQVPQQAQAFVQRPQTAAGDYRKMMMQSAKQRYTNSQTPRYNPYRQDGNS